MALNISSWSRTMLIQRAIATLALLIGVFAFSTMFFPFSDLQVGCGPAILGSKVEHNAPAESLIYDHEAEVCSNKGDSRIAVASVVTVLALGTGVAGWILPPGLPWWLTGEERPASKH
ncbi:MAG: hypothetical protein ACRDYC_04545 [Acidimicrobiales bacterium]